MKSLQLVSAILERESDSLDIYLKEINKEKILTSEEEVQIIQDYRSGNSRALDKIVKANLRFVVAVASYYQYKGLGLPDLIAEGNTGLLKAVDNFDETKGFKFISYAVFWIRKSMMQALSQHSRTIRLPGHMVHARRKITQLFLKLEQQFGQEPTLEELSAFSELDIDELRNVLQSEVKMLSIDEPVVADESHSLLDLIENTNAELPDRQVVHQDSLTKEMGFLFHGLSENQLAVVKMHYGMEGKDPMTLAEISIRMGLSKERIRQIKTASLKRMRAKKSHRTLEEYFGI